jgi:hypothetical protein
MMGRQKRALAFESEGWNGPEDEKATPKVLKHKISHRHVFIEWDELLLKKKANWERLKRMGLWPSEQGNNSNKKT